MEIYDRRVMDRGMAKPARTGHDLVKLLNHNDIPCVIVEKESGSMRSP